MAAGAQPESLDLDRPRGLGGLFATTVRLYGRHFVIFATIALAVVVPVDFVTLGLVNGQLFSGYPTEIFASGENATFSFVVMPLVTAMHVQAVLALDEGRQPTLRETLQGGGLVFTTVLGGVVLAGLGTILGLLLLILPGIYLFVRWYVTAQAIAVEGHGALAGLSRSAELVKGQWWRTFGVVLAILLVGVIGVALVFLPLDLAAEAADSGPLYMLGTMLSDALIASFVALTGTLLFFDLRARKTDTTAAVPEAGSGPPASDPPAPSAT